MTAEHEHRARGCKSELTTSQQRAQAIVDTINESGVTFVKLGQALSTRRDLVPEPYLTALASLQSSATTIPWETVRPAIEDGIGVPLDTLFASIDPAPLAAASVAQASGVTVLTMDLIGGDPLSRAADRLALLTADEREALANGLMATVIEQILVYGVFHADLHPGNVILRGDGTLGLIDFGAVGVIELSQRQHLTALMLAAVSEDDIAATDALLLIVDVPPDADLGAFRHDIGLVLTTERHRPRGDGSIFTRMVDVIRRHHIALPGDLAAAFRSFATLEGCLRVFVADFDMLERALPLVPRLLRRTISLRQLMTDVQARTAVTGAMVRSLPRGLDTLLTGLERGTVGIRLNVFGDESGPRMLRSITSDIVGTLVSIAAVVLAVVLLVSDTGPVVADGIRLFALLGALLGFFGFLGLLRVVRQTFVRR